MIVECAGCQTRFRLADEKIRPTGTKVRCSRCGSTFLVTPHAALLPGFDEPSVHEMRTQIMPIPADVLAQLRGADGEATQVREVPAALLAELRGATPGWGADRTPPPAASGRPEGQPPGRAFGAQRTPAPAWGLGAPPPPRADEWNGGAPPPPRADEWNGGAPPPPRADEWNGGAPPPPRADEWNGGAPAPADEWSLETPPPRFDASRTPTPAWSSAAWNADPEPQSFGEGFTDVTFGPGEPAAPRTVPLPAAPPVEDDPLAILGPAPELPPLGFGNAALDRFAIEPRQLDISPGPAPGLRPPPLPPGAHALPPTMAPPLPALSLELATEGWRPTAPELPAARPPPTMGMELDVAAAPAFEAAAPGVEPASDRRQPQSHVVAAMEGAVPLGRTRPAPPRLQQPATGRRRFVPLASGAAALVIALAGFVVARNGGDLRFDAAAVLGAFGLGEAPTAGARLVPEQLHTGRYPSGAGELFYVRGTIASQADATLGPAIRVVAELLDDQRVVARGVAWAGGEPTPEQLHGLRSPGDWEPLADRLGAGWARPIARGGDAPFFVVLGVAPAETTALRLRIAAEPAAAPGSPELPAAIADEG